MTTLERKCVRNGESPPSQIETGAPAKIEMPRIHTELRGKGGTKRGHCQQNLELAYSVARAFAGVWDLALGGMLCLRGRRQQSGYVAYDGGDVVGL
jgi:hypothetical protein